MFRSDIAGWTADGERIPKWTIRIQGKLAVDADGFRWTPLLPWRRPRVVEVSWSAVSQIDTGHVSAAGWKKLLLGVSSGRQFRSTLEAVGFSIHSSPAWQGRWFAMPPGLRPDWNRVCHEYGQPVGVPASSKPPQSHE